MRIEENGRPIKNSLPVLSHGASYALLSVARLSAQKNSTRLASQSLRYARIVPRCRRALERSLLVTITRQLQGIYSSTSARIYNLIKSGALSAETIFPRIVCGREPPQFRRDKSYARAWCTKLPGSAFTLYVSNLYICIIISYDEKFSPFPWAFSSLSTRILHFRFSLRYHFNSSYAIKFSTILKRYETSGRDLLLMIM